MTSIRIPSGGAGKRRPVIRAHVSGARVVSLPGGMLVGAQIEIERTEQPSGFRLAGELDLTTAPKLEEALRSAGSGEPLTLDVTDLRFMDSIGIRVLLTAAQEYSEESPLVLLNPSGEVRRVLEVSGLMGGAPGLRVEGGDGDEAAAGDPSAS
ncbi:MAG: STAS domain-containing protein [Actinomycetota bacterium]